MILALEVLGMVALVAVSSVLMRRQEAAFERRLRAQDEAEAGRRVALYKQQKESARIVARTDGAVRKLADQTRALHDDARLAQERAETILREVKDRG